MLGEWENRYHCNIPWNSSLLLRLNIWPIKLDRIFSGFAGVMNLSYLGTLFPGIAFLTFWQQLKGLDFRQIVRSYLLQRARTFIITGLKITGWCVLAFIPHLIKERNAIKCSFAPIGQSGIGWLAQNFFSIGDNSSDCSYVSNRINFR